MKRLSLLVLILIGCFAIIVKAQDATEPVLSHEMTQSYTFMPPEGFELKLSENSTGLHFSNGSNEFDFISPEQLVFMLNAVEYENTTDVLTYLVDMFKGVAVDVADVTALDDLADVYHQAVMWEYETETQKGTVIVYALVTGGFAYFDAYGESMDSAQLVTFAQQVTPIGGEEPFKTTMIPFDSGVTAEPCFANVATERTAQLRAGPGEHRSSITFLPANKDFTVLGKKTDDAGNLWYKMDKEEIDPKTGALELWVMASVVTTQGGCDAVVDADEPPIIPIAVRRPANADGTAPTVEVASNKVPKSGEWLWYYSDTANGSCSGSGNIIIPTEDIFGYKNVIYAVTLEVAPDGQSFMLNGVDEFNIISEGYYFNTVNLPELEMNGQIYVEVNNPYHLSGRLVANFEISGTPCSITLNMRMEYQG